MRKIKIELKVEPGMEPFCNEEFEDRLAIILQRLGFKEGIIFNPHRFNATTCIPIDEDECTQTNWVDGNIGIKKGLI